MNIRIEVITPTGVAIMGPAVVSEAGVTDSEGRNVIARGLLNLPDLLNRVRFLDGGDVCEFLITREEET